MSVRQWEIFFITSLEASTTHRLSCLACNASAKAFAFLLKMHRHQQPRWDPRDRLRHNDACTLKPLQVGGLQVLHAAPAHRGHQRLAAYSQAETVGQCQDRAKRAGTRFARRRPWAGPVRQMMTPLQNALL